MERSVGVAAIGGAGGNRITSITDSTDGAVNHAYSYVNGKLVQDFASGRTYQLLNFFYDDAGRPYAMKYQGAMYYYITNLQGDVLGLVDGNGSSVASYTYDPYGKVLSATGTLAEINPLRYRGYYYDVETGFYYLQSRYYDPQTGRFINADEVISSTSNHLQGYNMFAYCFNNPVNMTDVTGSWPKFMEDAFNWINGNVYQPFKKFITGIAEDVVNFDVNNQSEEKVLESNYFSAYKGVPVFRTNGNRSGSFGVIFLTRETNNREHPEDIIRHEYGHTKQLQQLGIVKFAIDIGIPSWLEIGGGDYYSRPWEITADIYGGVQSRHHGIEDISAGFSYLERSKSSGPFVWVFMY